MKLAYLILAHTDPTHFGRLCDRLAQSDCDIYVHIDANSDLQPFKQATQHLNLRFLPTRVSVSWGGISMIDAQNLLLGAALLRKTRYTHAVFLSGSCYPLRPASEIHRNLTHAPSTEFIKYIDMRESPDHYLRQVTQKWFKEPILPWVSNHWLRLVDKALRKLLDRCRLRNDWKDEITPYFGSQWCALTMECCQHIMRFQAENPWYTKMNKYTFSPDEHYYHTIIGNSKFAGHATGKQTFEGRGTWRLSNLHLVHPSLTKWYTMENIKALTESGKCFVRKVRSLDGQPLVDSIDTNIINCGKRL